MRACAHAGTHACRHARPPTPLPSTHPHLVVRMVGVRGHQEVELDVVALVGQDAVLKLGACMCVRGCACVWSALHSACMLRMPCMHVHVCAGHARTHARGPPTVLGHELGGLVHDGADVGGRQDDANGLGLSGQLLDGAQVEVGGPARMHVHVGLMLGRHAHAHTRTRTRVRTCTHAYSHARTHTHTHTHPTHAPHVRHSHHGRRLGLRLQLPTPARNHQRPRLLGLLGLLGLLHLHLLVLGAILGHPDGGCRLGGAAGDEGLAGPTPPAQLLLPAVAAAAAAPAADDGSGLESVCGPSFEFLHPIAWNGLRGRGRGRGRGRHGLACRGSAGGAWLLRPHQLRGCVRCWAWWW